MTKFDLETNLGDFVKLEGKDNLKFDIVKYVDYTIPIIDRYSFYGETPYRMIDRFIPQIVEEVYEFAMEREDIRNNDRVTSEFADIILYLVSVLTEIHFNFEYSHENEFRGIIISSDETTEDITKVAVNHQLYKGLKSNVEQKVLYLMANMRMKFPRRKYHVCLPEPEYTENPMLTVNALTEITVNILKNIRELISLFLIQLKMENGVSYEESLSDLNRCIKLKMQRNLNRMKDFSFI